MRAVLVLVALAGCATRSPEQIYAQAMNSPEWELCYYVVSGRSPAAPVNQAIHHRQIDCNRHMPMVQARMQQDAANRQAQMQSGAALLRAAQPQARPSSTTNCRSVMTGNVVNTVCD
jgi:hypothetical protein